MRRCLLLAAVAALGSAPTIAHAAAAVRLVEAYAAPEASRAASLKIAPMTEAQARDPAFAVMASRLGEGLQRAGFNLRQLDADTDVLVLLNYRAYGLAPFQTGFRPTNDPTYYALAVTAIDSSAFRDGKHVKVLWSTAVDSTGISASADRSIPRLIRGAERWFGRNTTGMRGVALAAGCFRTAGYNGSLDSAPPPTGSRIAGGCRGAPNQGGIVAAGVAGLGSPGSS